MANEGNIAYICGGVELYTSFCCMEKPEKRIKHYATVLAVGNRHVKVRLDEVSAEECGGCHMAGMCGKAGRTEIKIGTTQQASGLHVGDRVILTAASTLQEKAVIWTLALPVAIFLSVILGMDSGDCEGWVVALTSLGAVCLYFVFLRLVYPRLFRRDIWEITLVNKPDIQQNIPLK